MDGYVQSMPIPLTSAESWLGVWCTSAGAIKLSDCLHPWSAVLVQEMVSHSFCWRCPLSVHLWSAVPWCRARCPSSSPTQVEWRSSWSALGVALGLGTSRWATSRSTGSPSSTASSSSSFSPVPHHLAGRHRDYLAGRHCVPSRRVCGNATILPVRTAYHLGRYALRIVLAGVHCVPHLCRYALRTISRRYGLRTISRRYALRTISPVLTAYHLGRWYALHTMPSRPVCTAYHLAGMHCRYALSHWLSHWPKTHLSLAV